MSSVDLLVTLQLGVLLLVELAVVVGRAGVGEDGRDSADR